MKPPIISADEMTRRLAMLKPSIFTTDEVLDRLEILWRKLEDEGMYVSANTVALAIEVIKRPSK